MKTYTFRRGSHNRSTLLAAAATLVFAGIFILFSTFAFASAPQVVVDEVPLGSLSLWEVGDSEYNPVFTYQEIVSPHDGSTAIETSVVGNTIMMCETKTLKRTHEYSGNTSDTDLQAYLAFTSSMSYYNLPYVVIQLFSADDTVVGSQVYYGTDVTGSYYEGIITASPEDYTKLPVVAGDVLLDLTVMGSDIDFEYFTITLANYTCEGENSIIFDDLRIINGHIVDITPPVITLLGNAVVEVDVGVDYVDPGATAEDDVDGEVPVVVSGTVDTTTPATYTITYTATDTSGNESTLSRSVIVKEEVDDRRGSGGGSATRIGDRRAQQERGLVLGVSTSADDARLSQQREIVRLLQQLVSLLTMLMANK